MSAGRRGRGHGGGGHASSERWLLTYADLITLLLVFFVVLYALSQVDKEKYKKLKESLAVAMVVPISNSSSGGSPNIVDGGQGVMPGQGSALMAPEELQMEAAQKDIKALAKEADLGDQVQTEVKPEGLVVSISNAGFFNPGQASLRPDVVPLLDKIAKALKVNGISQPIRIEGHTDNTPINTDKFDSNWELSAVRAATIVRFLSERHGFDPSKLSATGYGEYNPKVANDTEAHRAQNRRVEIVILRQTPITSPPPAKTGATRF